MVTSELRWKGQFSLFNSCLICFSPSIVIVGDSNLVKLSRDIDNDNLLMEKKLTLRCRPGLRATHLDGEDLIFCSKFSLCLLMLGNNDISQHPTKSWIVPESPQQTAAKLCAFAVCLEEEKTDVRVIGLMPRPDVDYELVQKTNDYLRNFLGQLYVGPRKIHASHFIKPNSKDLAHLNYCGEKMVLALFLRVIETRF